MGPSSWPNGTSSRCWSLPLHATAKQPDVGGGQFMTRAYVFVEGPTDAEFLQRLLDEKTARDVQFVAGGGSGRLASLARTYLVDQRKPVAVVMDADSLNPELIV